MLIGCPNCGTNFSVPDSALGAKGRTLKCAKCGHKWFQAPLMEPGAFGLDELPAPPRRASPPPPPPRVTPPPPPPMAPPPPPLVAERFDEPLPEPNPGAAAARAAAAAFDFNLDVDDGAGHPEMDHEVEPHGLPESLTRPVAQPRKGGTALLWLVLIVMLVLLAGAGAYYYQDKVVEVFSPAEDVLQLFGLRHEKPGAGLELRTAGTPERVPYNDTEILIVRGIIANVSDRTRMVPPMKLMLVDKDKKVVQEKIDQPPVTSLDAGGTAGFKIQLQRPDANAVEINVIFVDPSEAQGK